MQIQWGIFYKEKIRTSDCSLKFANKPMLGNIVIVRNSAISIVGSCANRDLLLVSATCQVSAVAQPTSSSLDSPHASPPLTLITLSIYPLFFCFNPFSRNLFFCMELPLFNVSMWIFPSSCQIYNQRLSVATSSGSLIWSPIGLHFHCIPRGKVDFKNRVYH